MAGVNTRDVVGEGDGDSARFSMTSISSENRSLGFTRGKVTGGVAVLRPRNRLRDDWRSSSNGEIGFRGVEVRVEVDSGSAEGGVGPAGLFAGVSDVVTKSILMGGTASDGIVGFGPDSATRGSKYLMTSCEIELNLRCSW